MKQAINVYAEMTPNPNSLKFVADKIIIPTAKSAEFNSLLDAKGKSPLAEALFLFPFVKGVFMASNFITVVKSEEVPWDFVQMEVREFIKEWLSEDKEIIIQFPENRNESDNTNSTIQFTKSEFDEEIISLLDEYVRPAVEGDGGAIDFVGYQDGKVHLLLKGSCSGCPSSTATLKFGIESLLKQHIPSIEEVVAVNA
ncbi:MAG: NifU family protein [Flavobacteriia bacterium]|nr:NifU family protein [Flavobacteriia bacterium]